MVVPAGVAQAAPPAPFGHVCAPQNGVLFCPTTSDAERVPSFDGVPLDVDVMLPSTGDGPFPTIAMLHGYGGDKASFEATVPEGNGGSTYRYNNVYYAQQGYAVVTYTARGFGRSCGSPDSRTAPACDRGWLHLADQRFEARDTQHLLGLLVDQGVALGQSLGVTGISYGGIQTHNLARLRDRIRLANGAYQPWTSPNGTPLEIGAAWPRWGATDLTYALTPNGRFLDFGPFSPNQSRVIGGVPKKSFNDGLYLLGNLTGFYAPQGVDATADVTGWKALTDRGEPYRDDARAAASELSSYHSSIGVSGVPAPLLVQNGWTDDLLPVPEALRADRAYRGLNGAKVSFQFGDLGHSRGSNKQNADRFFNDQGAAFLAAHLKGQGTAPRHRSVTAFTQTCPRGAPAGGPFRASSWERLHPDSVNIGALGSQRISSRGGNPDTAKAFDKNSGGDACASVKAERVRGTAIAQSRMRRAITMLGLPTIRARIRTTGRGGMIAARLWDVFRGRQTLISRGVYRLTDNQKGRIVFQLFGNGWRFGRGHVAKLELLGGDPNFLRPSNNRFSVRIKGLTLELPTR
jgi:fermentation-respiration switch protein FrsA (DUF1100 family)